MKSLRVGVIFGGRSVEHDVSILTAHQVMAVLSPRHEVVPVYVTRGGRWLAGSPLNDLAVYRDETFEAVGKPAFISPVRGEGLQLVGSRLRGAQSLPLDVVVPAIHGTFGEDGTLQGLLELAGLPYTGSGVAASAVGMDKVSMKTAFKGAGLRTVDHVVVHSGQLERDEATVLDGIEARIGYPAFVKPAQLGSSVGIGRAANRGELSEALSVAGAYDNRVLVEPSMDGCIEVNCSVLGGAGREPRASVCEQPVRHDDFLSFDDKYLRGAKAGGTKSESSAGMASLERLIPAPIPDELTKQVQTNAVDAFSAVGASGVARIDSFVDPDAGDAWVMEINTVPGSFSFYLWQQSGLEFPELMEALIEIALERAAESDRRMFTFDSNLLSTRQGIKSGG